MKHDIYSLGVCLLDIGLWSSFVLYGFNERPKRPQTYDIRVKDSFNVIEAEHTKTCLLALATQELVARMGTRYARVVESCLTCLFLGNEGFGDKDEIREDGNVIAVKYIEKVYLHIRR